MWGLRAGCILLVGDVHLTPPNSMSEAGWGTGLLWPCEEADPLAWLNLTKMTGVPSGNVSPGRSQAWLSEGPWAMSVHWICFLFGETTVPLPSSLNCVVVAVSLCMFSLMWALSQSTVVVFPPFNWSFDRALSVFTLWILWSLLISFSCCELCFHF